MSRFEDPWGEPTEPVRLKKKYLLVEVELPVAQGFTLNDAAQAIIGEVNAQWRNTHPLDKRQNAQVLSARPLTMYLLNKLFGQELAEYMLNKNKAKITEPNSIRTPTLRVAKP